MRNDRVSSQQSGRSQWDLVSDDRLPLSNMGATHPSRNRKSNTAYFLYTLGVKSTLHVLQMSILLMSWSPSLNRTFGRPLKRGEQLRRSETHTGYCQHCVFLLSSLLYVRVASGFICMLLINNLQQTYSMYSILERFYHNAIYTLLFATPMWHGKRAQQIIARIRTGQRGVFREFRFQLLVSMRRGNLRAWVE